MSGGAVVVASPGRFERLYEAQYRPLVGFFFRRVDDVELARDLAAETFRIAWSRWAEPGAHDRAWLFGIARHLVVDEYRRRDRDRRRLIELAGRLPAAVVRDERAEDVRAVLSGLSKLDQEVLRLTYWDGLDARETAVVLGVTRSAVWVRLHRARRAFAASWAAEPVTANPA